MNATLHTLYKCLMCIRSTHHSCVMCLETWCKRRWWRSPKPTNSKVSLDQSLLLSCSFWKHCKQCYLMCYIYMYMHFSRTYNEVMPNSCHHVLTWISVLLRYQYEWNAYRFCLILGIHFYSVLYTSFIRVILV